MVLGAAIVDVLRLRVWLLARDWRDGLSASLRAGLRAVDAEHVVLHTVDAPDVSADVVRRVLDAARSSPSGLARARYGDRPGIPSSSREGTGRICSRGWRRRGCADISRLPHRRGCGRLC